MRVRAAGGLVVIVSLERAASVQGALCRNRIPALPSQLPSVNYVCFFWCGALSRTRVAQESGLTSGRRPPCWAAENLSCGKYDTNFACSSAAFCLVVASPQVLRIIVIMKRASCRIKHWTKWTRARGLAAETTTKTRRGTAAGLPTTACQQRLFHAVKHSNKSNESRSKMFIHILHGEDGRQL